MPENERVICKSHAVIERKHGLRFPLPQLGEHVTGFVIRYNSLVYAYINQCAHLSVELDWNEGDFYDLGKNYVICATHGAQYQPETGYCIMGPCKGRSLQAIQVTERNDEIIINLESLKNVRKY